MTMHTKEPWEVYERFRGDGLSVQARVDIDQGTHVTQTVAEIGSALPVNKANARRIVACVNALEGIPTEFLEAVHSDDMRAWLGDQLAEWRAENGQFGVGA